MTQITHPAVSKYDLALMFTLLTLIDSRLAELETDNARIGELRRLLHQSVLRYDVAYKQSTKSFLTETIGKKDTARDKVTKANTLTAEIQQLMQQRQTDSASYQKGEMAAARQEAEQLLAQVIQYLNALLVVSPDAALEETAQYIQQDFNKVEAQYQQSRKHGKKEDPQPDGGKDDGEGGDVTPVTPEA